jgi:hypothetical protein
MREYLVSPTLTVLRQEGMSDKARGKMPANETLTDVRFERVLDSAVAGVLAGGTLSGFLRASPWSLKNMSRTDNQVGKPQYREQASPLESSLPYSNFPPISSE